MRTGESLKECGCGKSNRLWRSQSSTLRRCQSNTLCLPSNDEWFSAQILLSESNFILKQECIPVGRVPPNCQQYMLLWSLVDVSTMWSGGGGGYVLK